MSRNQSTRLDHVRDHILGLVLGTLLVKFGVVALRVEERGATRAIITGGLVGTVLVPAMSRLSSRRTIRGGSV